jgi:SAM-dependent methyltransferase
LIDYDQAIRLSEQQVKLNNSDFFKFCSEYDRTKYGFGDWLRHFRGVFTHEAVDNLLINGSLNLIDVSLIKTQNTTNTDSGLYHAIDHKEIFLAGNRGINARASILDKLEFKNKEKVLDVGCNQGLLSFYLHDRGCQVTGYDIDPFIISAANITTNIIKKDINFIHKDLDKVDTLPDFDTIMLFSVFHHTTEQIENGKKIANACNRIIIETRLHENGSQPIGLNGEWMNVSAWRFVSLEQLTSTLEKVFPGFKFSKNLGVGSKGRYILEFTNEQY